MNLSTVWDLSADYQLTRCLNATLYYAHASGRRVIAGSYPNDKDSSLAYIETTVHF